MMDSVGDFDLLSKWVPLVRVSFGASMSNVGRKKIPARVWSADIFCHGLTCQLARRTSASEQPR